MDKIEPKTSEIQFFVILRQIRLLAIAIILSLSLVFFTGLAVSGSYVNPSLAIYNLVTFLLCPFFCAGSYLLKKNMLKKVTLSNFTKSYFSAIVLPYALCELGGIICITTNLFMNQNILYASIGYALTMLYLFFNFPREEDYRSFAE
jgi:hypothetical protein